MAKGADVVVVSTSHYFTDNSALIRTPLAEQNDEVREALTKNCAGQTLQEFVATFRELVDLSQFAIGSVERSLNRFMKFLQ